MKSLQEYDIVRTNKAINNVPMGSIGTVLIIYPSNPIHYEVEFVDRQGDTIAVLTVSSEDVEAVDII